LGNVVRIKPGCFNPVGFAELVPWHDRRIRLAVIQRSRSHHWEERSALNAREPPGFPGGSSVA
jgi:hypothetical protein